MPTLEGELHVQPSFSPARIPSPRVVHTPRPRLEPYESPPWLPAPVLRRGLRLTVSSPDLPVIQVEITVRDTEAEAMSVMLATILSW